MSRALSPTPRALSRRTFLRGAGVAMGLPLLDAMRPLKAAGKADFSGYEFKLVDQA